MADDRYDGALELGFVCKGMWKYPVICRVDERAFKLLVKRWMVGNSKRSNTNPLHPCKHNSLLLVFWEDN